MRDGPVGFWVDMMANRRNGVVYTGHTDNLWQRVQQHRNETFDGFSKRHGCKTLVWAEWYETRHGAFRRERRIKEWRRSWKLMLVEARNPTWRDMLDDYITA